MRLKKRQLIKSRLYAVIDRKVLGKRGLLNTIKKLKNSGVDIIQLRDKESTKSVLLKKALLLKRILPEEVIFIINDYLDIAKIIDSDGVHLGQEDSSVETARRILGKDKIIGVSCHTLSEALEAEKSGADYISIGPIFHTSTKPEYKAVGLGLIKKARRKVKIPFFAIGGINKENIASVLSSGAKNIAVSRAVCQADNAGAAARNFSKILHRHDPIRVC